MKKMGWVLIAALTLAAGALIGAHLQPPSRVETYRLTASRAGVRLEERMEVSIPAGPVNINRAGLEELQTLPGVGPAIAQRIADERMQNGPFHYPEDLLAVYGIGAKKLEKIRPQISINK